MSNTIKEGTKIDLGHLNDVSSEKLRAIMLNQGEENARHQINLIIQSLHTALGLDTNKSK
jgi:hypothetical protein